MLRPRPIDRTDQTTALLSVCPPTACKSPAEKKEMQNKNVSEDQITNFNIFVWDASLKPGSYFMRSEFDMNLTSQLSFLPIFASELSRD